MTAHIATVRPCRTPGCLNPYEPYANDGHGEYRTEDFDGMCESCNSLAVNCAVCEDRFVSDDPSDPDCQLCPACAAEPSGVTCEEPTDDQEAPDQRGPVSTKPDAGTRAPMREVQRMVAR